MSAWGVNGHPDTVSSLMPVLISRHNERQAASNPGRPLPAARLHDLRHIHATTLLRAGVPVHVVAARLGHADPSMVASGIRCKRDGRGSGFMVMLGDGTDISGAVTGLGVCVNIVVTGR